MTYKNYGEVITMVATDVEKYRFVALGTSEERLAQYPANKGEIVGATENAVEGKGSISVALRGVVEVTAAEAISIGQKVSTNAEGKAVAYTDGEVVGVAFTAANGDGERISVLLK